MGPKRDIDKEWKQSDTASPLNRRPIARLIGGSEGRMKNRMKNRAVGELASGKR